MHRVRARASLPINRPTSRYYNNNNNNIVIKTPLASYDHLRSLTIASGARLNLDANAAGAFAVVARSLIRPAIEALDGVDCNDDDNEQSADDGWEQFYGRTSDSSALHGDLCEAQLGTGTVSRSDGRRRGLTHSSRDGRKWRLSRSR